MAGENKALNIINICESIRASFAENPSPNNAIRILDRLTQNEYHILDLDQEECWPNVCEVVNILLNALPSETILKSRHEFLLLLLINKAPERVVRFIVEDYLSPKYDKIHEALRTRSSAILIAVTRRIDGTLCNEAVARFISHFINEQCVRSELISLLNVENVSSITRFHVYQVAMACMLHNKRSWDFESIDYLIEAMLRELCGTDTLNTVTILNMFSEAIEVSKLNAIYFNTIEVVEKAFNLLQRSRHSPDGGHIFTACIRFFGTFCQLEPDTVFKCYYKEFVDLVLDMCCHFFLLDLSNRLLAFQTFARLSASPLARSVLSGQTYKQRVEKTLNHWGVAIVNSPDEVRYEFMRSLAQLMNSFKTPPTSPQIESSLSFSDISFSECEDLDANIIALPNNANVESSSEFSRIDNFSEPDTSVTSFDYVSDLATLKHWFECIGEPLPTLLMQYLGRAIEKSRIGVLELLKVLFNKHNREWAIPKFAVVHGFFEYLLDTSPDTNLTYWILKHDVIYQILNPSPMPTSLEPELTQRLCEFSAARLGYFPVGPLSLGPR